MPKHDGPAWLAKLGIDRNGVRLVGMVRGMITLTRDADGIHTLWIFDYPLREGDAATLRAAFAEYGPEYFKP